MTIKDLPNWCTLLSKEPKFTELGFSLYDEEDFKKYNTKEKNIFSFGSSLMFSMQNILCLAVDMQKPDLLRISFNVKNSEIFFYTLPTIEKLEEVFEMYISRALAIPEVEDEIDNHIRLLDAQPASFSNPLKKEILFSIGHGDWTNDMIEMENSMIFNRYFSIYCICQATAHTHAESATRSQYFTAFSASLCSIIRYRAFERIFYYLSFEYIPINPEYTIQFKKLHPQNSFIQQFPDDAPLDILGTFLDNPLETLFTHSDVLNMALEGEFKDVLYLAAMTDLTDKFEEIYLPLASHSDIKVRDFIASEAIFKKNDSVIFEVLKHGVSESMIHQINEYKNKK